MKLKIFKKLFLNTACVLIVTLTLLFVLLSIAINNTFTNNKYDVLSESCNVISEELLLRTNDIDDSLYSLVESLSRVNKLDLYVADHYGKIHICSCNDFKNNKNCIHTNTILSRKFLKNITSDGNIELSSIDGLYEKMNYTSSKKVTTNTGDNFYIIAVSDVMSVSELIKTILGIYAISAIVPLIFMFVAEYSVMYRITKPLKYMSISARAIADGDFSKRVPVMSNDEIGELSVLFNKMTDSLSLTEMTGKSFVANVSHELRTPMTTISGFIDGIIDGTIDEEHKDYYLGIISQEIKRLSRLVQSMLSLAKLESGEVSITTGKFALSDIIVLTVISMEKKIEEKNINVIGLDGLTETVISGDKDLLHQLIFNLTDNAVKFTKQNGTVEFNLHRFNDKIELKIKNTGDGIPENDLPHIFERFYKIDKSRSTHKDSLGLGLYICKTITDLHKGKISAKSVLGEYTEFQVELPIG